MNSLTTTPVDLHRESLYYTMIKNPERYAEFDRRAGAADRLTYEMKLRLLDGLYEEARRFGHFSGLTPLEGIEEDIRLAAMLNGDVRKPPR